MSQPRPELAAVEKLQQAAGAYFLSRCLHVAADLGIADYIGDAPVAASELARATGSHVGALGRILNLLCAHGIFERRDGGYVHTATSRLLQTNHPESMRSFVRLFGLPLLFQTAMKLDRAVQMGQSVSNDVFSGGVFAYFAQNPEANRIFNEAMAGKAHGEVPAILAAYDFSKFGLIGDIGGGRGHLLEAILAACPGSKGVLFDLPHVLKERTPAASSRITLSPGDFFKDPIPVCDAYVLMEVIHDWPDEEARAIFKAVRRAAPRHAKLLVIEAPIPNDPGPCWTKTLDIVMLDLLGGSQRTPDEYRKLLADSGFCLDRVIDTAVGYSIFEASVV